MVTPAIVASAPLPPGGDLVSQLAAEASARPDNTTTLERIIAALGAQGIEVASFQQSIARTHGAAYCGNVRSAELYLFICEYPGAAQLAAGRPLSEAIFKGIADHAFVTSKSTSVMVQPLTPASAAVASKARAIIQAL